MKSSNLSWICAFGKASLAHVQVLSNIVDFKMDAQAALDAPRWCIVGPDSFLGPSSAADSRCA